MKRFKVNVKTTLFPPVLVIAAILLTITFWDAPTAVGQEPLPEGLPPGEGPIFTQDLVLICDDGDSCFSYNGGWNPPTNPNQYCKYGGDMRFGYACWLAADCQPDTDNYSVFWRPYQVGGFVPGNYEVFAYIPRCDSYTPHTQSAKYYLRHAGDLEATAPLIAIINQAHPYQDNNDCSDGARWASLGTHYFDSGTYVEMRAWTDESASQWGTRHHVIFADAMKFSFRDGPSPGGLTYIGPRYLPSSSVMLGEVDGKITMGDHVHLQLPFRNTSNQTVHNAGVWFDGRTTTLASPSVWIARSDNLSNWGHQMGYGFDDVPPGATVYADIVIYVDRYTLFLERKSLRGTANLRLDYGQDFRDNIVIDLDAIEFTPSAYHDLTYPDDCLHHPSNFDIRRYAQYAAARPYGPQDPVSEDPDTPEKVVRNLVASVNEQFDYRSGVWNRYRVPDTTLLTRRGGNIGECRHYADLTVGLLRSLGIPTRRVSANGIRWDNILEHDWGEVYVNRSWRQADSTWKVAFDEGIYERNRYTLFGVWADQYPLAAIKYFFCAPSCYQPPVSCDTCLREIDHRWSLHFGCTENVRSRYHNVSSGGVEVITAENLDMPVNIQAPVFVTHTLPFTMSASFVNSTTQTLDLITATVSTYEDISSTVPLYEVMPAQHIYSHMVPGETITAIWTVTPLLVGNQLPLQVVVYSGNLFGIDERSLVVNEQGTLPPLILGGLCGPGTVQPGQPFTLTTYVFDEELQPVADNALNGMPPPIPDMRTAVTANVYSTPTLDYLTIVPLYLDAGEEVYREVVTLPSDAPLGPYLVEFVATRPGYDEARATASFFVNQPLTTVLDVDQPSMDLTEPLSLTVSVYERNNVVSEASVRAEIDTLIGTVTVPLAYNPSRGYVASFSPSDLSGNLGGRSPIGRWVITAIAEYYGASGSDVKSISVGTELGSVYLPIILKGETLP